MFLDKILIDTTFMEIEIIIVCDVSTWYGYSCLCTPLPDSPMNKETKMSLDKITNNT
jgi:hypothetical protein